MFFKIISEQKEWECFCATFPHEYKDIYFDYRYARAYERNGDGEIYCAIFNGDNGMKALYPFIKTKIPDYNFDQDYYDIASCYGYGGPLIYSYNHKDIEVFESNLHDWCLQNNIVAEFIRFHPLLDNHDKFSRDIIVEENRTTVYVDLDTSLEKVWNNSLNSKNRNQVRKAEKSGISIRETTNLLDFIDIYKETMQRIGAEKYYYFSKSYFEEMQKLIPENMIIFEAVYEEKVIAAAMFMYKGNQMHYHLAGSLKEYQNLCPNNLLIWAAIKFGIDKGFKYLHLGGGTTNSKKDSLFKFKAGFSSNFKNFYIGKRVHNKNIYDLLIHKWEEKNNRQARLFLQYEFE